MIHHTQQYKDTLHSCRKTSRDSISLRREIIPYDTSGTSSDDATPQGPIKKTLDFSTANKNGSQP